MAHDQKHNSGAPGDAATAFDWLPNDQLAPLHLDAYFQQYPGRSRLQRQIFVAQHVPAPLAKHCVDQALQFVKSENNVALYKDIHRKFGEQLNLQADQSWIDATEKANQVRHEELQNDLNLKRQTVVSDQIRAATNDLAEFYHRTGNLQAALSEYVRGKENCSNPSQRYEQYMILLKIAVQARSQHNIQSALSSLNRSDMASTELRDPAKRSAVKALSGLESFLNKQYSQVPRLFSQIGPELTDISDFMSFGDIALYGTLCALATSNRQALKSFIQEGNFKRFLEPHPQLKQLVLDFYSTKYADCLQTLDLLQPRMLRDVFLRTHAASLIQMIRQKALIQYFSPYSQVDLNQMAASFNTNVVDLERELALLIVSDRIQARIDSKNKVLQAKQADERAATYRSALQTGQAYVRDTKALLLRMSMARNDMTLMGHGPQHHGPNSAGAPSFSSMMNMMGDRFSRLRDAK